MTTCGENGGVKVDGTPCPMSSGLSPDSGLCFWHDPKREEEAVAARSKGGQATARKRAREPINAPPPPQTIEDAKLYASWAVEAVASGRVDYRVGNTIQAILRDFRSATEKAELEKEIAELRGIVAELKAHNKGGTR
jgi:hypothetical protein